MRASSLVHSALDSGMPESSARSPVSVVLLPLGDLPVLVDLFETGEDGLVAQGDELVAAEVVGAALHVADAQRAEERFKEGDVAEVELVLQGLGAGGDDDALAGAEGGQQVGEGFAGAGAGFDDEVAALFEGALDGLGHFKLAGAVLVGQRQNAPGCRREQRTRAAWAGRGFGFSLAGIESRRLPHHSDAERYGRQKRKTIRTAGTCKRPVAINTR